MSALKGLNSVFRFSTNVTNIYLAIFNCLVATNTHSFHYLIIVTSKYSVVFREETRHFLKPRFTNPIAGSDRILWNPIGILWDSIRSNRILSNPAESDRKTPTKSQCYRDPSDPTIGIRWIPPKRSDSTHVGQRYPSVEFKKKIFLGFSQDEKSTNIKTYTIQQ